MQNNTRIGRYGHWLIRWRWVVILSSLMMTFLLAGGALKIRVDDSYRYVFEEGSEILAAFDDLQNAYNKNDNIVLVMAPKGGNVFDRAFLAAVEEVTERSWQIPNAVRVDSLTNFQHTSAVNDDLLVENLGSPASELTDADLARIKEIALKEPKLVNQLVSPKGHVTAVNITLELPENSGGKQSPSIPAIRKLVDDLKGIYPDIEFYVSGVVMLNNAFFEASVHDMTTLIPIMYLVIFGIMYLLLRTVSGTFATGMLIFVSVSSVMGLIGWLGLPLTPPSSTSPTLIMTVAVADSIHFLTTMLQLMRGGMSKNNAIVESLRINFVPILITSLTTCIGFLTLNFADMQPLIDLGNIVAIGVVFAFVYTIWFLPALIAVLPLKVAGEQKASTSMGWLAEWVIRHPKGVMLGGCAICLTIIPFLLRNELNDDLVKYFDESTSFRQDTDYATRELTGIYQVEYSLLANGSGGICEPEYLATLERFTQWFRDKPITKQVNSMSDTFKRLNKNMHGDDPAFDRLPESREMAAQYLLLYEMSLPYGLDLNNQVNLDKSGTRFSATINDATTREIRQIAAEGDQWLRDNAPQYMQANASGPPVMFAILAGKNIISMLFGTAWALGLISLLLMVIFRNLKIGLVSIIPNLLPVSMAFGLWGIISGQINMGLTIVSALSIGIVVDDSIHFISKYLRARKEKGFSPNDSVRYAFDHVGRAMIVTTTILVCGFCILSFSSFDMNAGMGKLTAMTILIAILADMTLLPALLLLVDKYTDTVPSKTSTNQEENSIGFA